jgi:hypothetical protein
MTSRVVPIAHILVVLTACAEVHSSDSIQLGDPMGGDAGRPESGRQLIGKAAHGRIDAGSHANAPRPTLEDGAILGPDAAGPTPTTEPSFAVDGSSTSSTTEVWIGQIWAHTFWGVCDPNMANMPPPPQLLHPEVFDRVVLILERNQAATLGGHIQFDEAMGPAAPSPDLSSRDAQMFANCYLSKGFEYTLLNAVRTNVELTFAIAPGELWDAWCAKQASAVCTTDEQFMTNFEYCKMYGACECSSGKCSGNRDNLLVFKLALTADTIEGKPPVGGELRLRRVQ